MELKDLVKDEIYIATFEQNKKGIIFKYEGKFSEVTQYGAINLFDNTFLINGYLTATNLNLTIKKASKEQENWLNSCISANKFILQDQIPNNELLIQNVIIW